MTAVQLRLVARIRWEAEEEEGGSLMVRGSYQLAAKKLAERLCVPEQEDRFYMLITSPAKVRIAPAAVTAPPRPPQ